VAFSDVSVLVCMLWTAVGLLTAPCHPHVEPDGLSRMEGIGGKAGWSWIVSPPFFFPRGPSR
jgi:hypothetical protein